ncbi:MAG: DUF4105 domain-containing protein [Gammaproteobacteria bacterium]|nr:DUF4105 domain-containing protein [Gammaproteobacteria bacterium]MBU1440411.1 DUF4105 domain-containing protein [Gammaproteobacteria bacterium]MBU2289090.1 DUF4105 domain-containing protein [Gammaproteobacteria bacterium]MBU2408185.1 DUF4105 domain-containing protein [Gammaproteobacteria bacterium]
MKRSILLTLGCVAVSVVVLVSALWACLGFWFQLQLPSAGKIAAGVLWAAFALAAIVLLWRGRGPVSLVVYALGFTLVLIWWGSIRPLQDRPWADDVSRQFVARVDGSKVILDNVRDFAWRTDTDYTPRWETRQYDLDHLRSVDVAASYWTGPWIAHTLVSFGFDDGRFLTFSIEIRKERDESFSSIGGFFKEFETVLVAAEERDILRVRTNVRGEDVFLYRVRLGREDMRSLFLAYLDEARSLKRAPQFYNTLTANCTTIVYELARRVVPDLPLDYRLLASGWLPNYLHDVGGLMRGYTLHELRDRGRITARANATDVDADFSQAIRKGMPVADAGATDAAK